jgi:hypothetical protein
MAFKRGVRSPSVIRSFKIAAFSRAVSLYWVSPRRFSSDFALPLASHVEILERTSSFPVRTIYGVVFQVLSDYGPSRRDQMGSSVGSVPLPLIVAIVL